MSLAALAPEIALWALWAADETPKPEDVTAGWTAFAVFLLLGAAVAVLGVSLAKHLRKAEDAKRAGVYGDEVSGTEEVGGTLDGDETAPDRRPADRPDNGAASGPHQAP